MSMEGYRDYTGLAGIPLGTSASEFARVKKKKTQVYIATHEGERYLPFMNRSFLSFSFGGKNIEDFDLIATMSADGFSKNGYSDFEDIVSNYDILDGSIYWGTHFKNLNLEFDLVTDGITLQELDEFLHWFIPGQNRELILSEHPNRAIIARVLLAPNLNLTPFEEKIEAPIGNSFYKTSTTLYKGHIQLNFTSDSPFWYAKVNIFGYSDHNNVFHDMWTDANGNQVSVYDNPDAIKVAYEDGIPISSMLSVSLLLGDNTFANMDSELNGIIAQDPASVLITRDIRDDSITITSYTRILDEDTNEETGRTEEATWVLYNSPGNTIPDILKIRAMALMDYAIKQDLYVSLSYITNLDAPDIIFLKLKALSVKADENNDPPTYLYKADDLADVNPRSVIATVDGLTDTYISGARIAGAIMDKTTGIERLLYGQYGYFYYAGTAPSKPVLTFTLAPRFNASDLYIIGPNNPYNNTSLHYNTITIESVTKQEFKFTLPSIYMSYNQVLDILDHINVSDTWEAVRERIRLNIKNKYVRAWANKVLDSITRNGDVFTPSNISLVRQFLYYMFVDTAGTVLPSTFIFDSRTGTATGKIGCRTIESYYTVPTPEDVEGWLAGAGDVHSLANDNPIIMDVGDMVLSDYLIIRDRNYPDEQGRIRAWEYGKELTHTNSHIIYHDFNLEPRPYIENVFIEYLNMYL